MNIVMDQKEITRILEAHIHARLHDASSKLKVTYTTSTTSGITATVQVIEANTRPFVETYA